MKDISRRLWFSVALTVFATIWLGGWDAEYQIYHFIMPVWYNLFYNGFAVLLSFTILIFIWHYNKSKAMLAAIACYNTIMSFWALMFAVWLYIFDFPQFVSVYYNTIIGLGLNEFVSMEWFWLSNEVWMSVSIVLWLFAFMVKQ